MEAKSPVAVGTDYTHAIKRLARYQREVPRLFVPNQIIVATDGLEFRYAATGAPDHYFFEWKDPSPHNIPEHQEMKRAVFGLLDRANFLHIVQNFIVFETREGKTVKKICRYQQFRAANKIVERVLDGRHKRGLIWHTQGSGKSLTMLFAAWKLRRHPALKNPTVFIVVDRRDLDRQISDTFVACDFPNTTRAFSIADLRKKIAGDHREVIITTVHKFQDIEELTEGENVIVLVDEAHRTQEGELAIQMRSALRNAFLFGFTGTPIDRGQVGLNTHRNFGPILEDGRRERYLDLYSIKQSIEDGATVPVHFTGRVVKWSVSGEELDRAFKETFGHLEVEDRERLKREQGRLKVLLKHPDRVQQVGQDVANHFREHVQPNGFKAQLVAVDREACALYKEELDRLMDPEESSVIYSPSADDDERMRKHHKEKTEQERVISNFKNPDHPLSILIVTDMLLTGFDAPVEQVMYLDRMLRDHALLQAIARTNRPYTAQKINGLVVDYVGVFQNVPEALDFDEAEIEECALDLEALKAQFPMALASVIDLFVGIVRDDSYESFTACLLRLGETEETGLMFEQSFGRVQALFETLAPDPFLAQYLPEYRWACRMYVAYLRRFKREAKIDWDQYGAKTRQLIYDSVQVADLERDLPVYKIDENYLTKVIQLELTPDEKASEIEHAIKAELKVRRGTNPIYESLSERLERILHEKYEGTLRGIELMKELQVLVEEMVEVEREADRLGLGPAEHALFQLLALHARDADPARLVSVARELAAMVRQHTFEGWQSKPSVRREIERELTLCCHRDHPDLGLYPGAFRDEAMDLILRHLA